MFLCVMPSLETISNIVSIITPIILLLWFYYSQKQKLSKEYFDTIDGTYAGFTDLIHEYKDDKVANAGILMYIKDTDDKGYFKGNFFFSETQILNTMDVINFKTLQEGNNTFVGKMEFEIFKNKGRHPFQPKENRIYKGKLYVVTRLDFDFENYNMEDYLHYEYNITHYREMGTLKFQLRKIHNNNLHGLPKSFVLYKRIGVTFEPYESLKDVVFTDWSRFYQE